MESIEEKFEFWCPIQKSEDLTDPTTGERIMRLGGIASTSDEDSDGEFLDPKGFDIQPLLKSGLVNWHHQAKEHPDTIIGEPTKAEIRSDGLYIETDLYPSSKVALDVWELAETLEKDSKTRRLGYSIEGKVLKRKSNDKNNPDYKHVEKAIITGVAITHMPKNPKTFANIIKGDIGEPLLNDAEEERAGETYAERKSYYAIEKAETMERLFSDMPSISIEKAERIYTLIKKISIMAKKTKITDEDIAKAYETLGFNVEEENLRKGCGGSDDDEEVEKGDDEEDDEETTKKPKTDAETDDEEDDDEEDDEVEEAKGVSKGNFDELQKAIISAQGQNSRFIRALGVMIKDASQKLDAAAEREEELLDIVKAQKDTIAELSDIIEEFGNGTPAPKSLSHARAVERSFMKGGDSDFTQQEEEINKGENVFSMSRNSREVAELLDQATFSKGYDEEFSKACTSFEATHCLPKNVIARMKSEYNVEIVD